MRDKIRVGIVGCGAQAQLVHIPGCRKNRHCEIVAICDSDARKLNILSSRYNIPKHYLDFSQILRDETIDALIISTPNYLHHPMSIAALKYGKDVLCEMPLALTASQAKEMIDVAKKEKRLLVPCLNDRLRPDVNILKKFIDGGELGSIYYTKAGWLRGKTGWSESSWWNERLRAGGGAFLALGSQILDLALPLLEPAKPISIIGMAYKREIEKEVEDTAFAFIRFDMDLVLTIEVGWSLLFEKDFQYLNAYGTKGAALLNPIQIQREMHGNLVNVTPSFSVKDPLRNSFQLVIDFFVDALRKETECPIKSEEALVIHRVIDSFYESSKSKKEIIIKN